MKWSQIVALVGAYEGAVTTDDSSDGEKLSAWTVARANSPKPFSYISGRSYSPEGRLPVSAIAKNSGFRAAGQRSQPMQYSQGASGQFFRPSEQDRSLASQCHYCGNLGHIKSNCRRFLGQCLLCGSAEHYLRACPHRGGDQQNKSGSQIVVDGTVRKSTGKRVQFQGKENAASERSNMDKYAHQSSHLGN